MSFDDALSLYDYELPEELIAQHPLERRDASRLMVLAGTQPPDHRRFTDLPDFLQPGDVLVRNNTRVIPARLRGTRSGGGKTEFLLVHRMDEQPDAGPDERWLCLARPTSHLKPGKTVVIGNCELEALIEERRGAGNVVVRFSPRTGASFRELLEAWGEVPLPPYIQRDALIPCPEDVERYQTIYAEAEGAVAAPTAGLHFTPEVEAALVAKGISFATVTLHVGPGTFRPIKAESLDAHAMDEEFYILGDDVAATLNAARAEGRRIIAVGTTSTRALESATDEAGITHAGRGWTRLFIRPGYAFRAINGLLTNFHLPRSSLLVLVSSLAGRERMLAAYAEAVRQQYRFYSYGDAMLILP